MSPLETAAKAMFEEYSEIEHGYITLQWDDLATSAKICWKAVASAGIKAYNRAMEAQA